MGTLISPVHNGNPSEVPDRQRLLCAFTPGGPSSPQLQAGHSLSLR